MTANTKNGTPGQLAAARHESLSRRKLLRGLGAAIALPTLGSLYAPAAFAKAVRAMAPTRMAFVYVPNGAIPGAFWPAAEHGAAFELSPTLLPLAKVHKQLQVIAGLTDLSANAGADGAGDHARASGTFLTGVRINKTAGRDIRAGVSIDQVIANQIGHLTRFPSLELTCDAVRKSGACDSGYSCAYQYNLAWRSHNHADVAGAQSAFRLRTPVRRRQSSERVANLKRRQAEQRSILDFVLEDARSMQRRTRRPRQAEARSVPDRRARDRTAHREVIAAAGQEPRRPMRPTGIPDSYEEYVALMFDMLALAFETDSTRVATLLSRPRRQQPHLRRHRHRRPATTTSRITRTRPRSSRR